ncbi:MAG: zinc metallopeptidase [bacterium]
MDLILILAILSIPAIAQLQVTTSYSKYKNIENEKGLTGQEVAAEILKKNGLEKVYVVETEGNLSDHYDSSRKVVRLSKDIYNGTSIASMAVAAHEVGHAIQDKDGYTFMRIRSAIYPVVNFGTQFSYIILLIGMLLGSMDFVNLGIALTALGLVFQVVTLPVEFDASTRAKKELDSIYQVSKSDELGVKKMLDAAAMTYVAGVLASALNILRLIMATRGDE